jgi:hypothetical protein
MSQSRIVILTLFTMTSCTDDSLGVDQFVEDYLEAYCGYLMRCCDSPERSYTTKQSCIDGRRPLVDAMLAFRNAETPFATFVTAEARSCIDVLGRDCETATTSRDCLSKVAQGQHTSGEDCTYSAECDSFYCIQSQKGAKGYCAGSSGGACSGDDRACSTGSFCDDATSQCDPRRDPGDNCHRPEMCKSGVCSPQKLCVSITDPFCDGL